MIIGGFEYSVINLGGNVWMVRRFNDDEEDTFKESLVTLEGSEEEVIRLAIKRGSWA
jgi:hypothetical protein